MFTGLIQKIKLITFAAFIMVSINIESQQIISLYQEAVPNSMPYQMKKITGDENGKLMCVRNITKPASIIYLTEAEMTLKEKE